MEPEAQAAKKLLNSDLKGTDLRRAIDQLREKAQKIYWDLKKKSYFKPKNKVGEAIEKMSPSGKYRLVIEGFETNGGWNYSQGTVYVTVKDKPIGIIQRNYSVFPYCWVEGHSNGHDYLVAGEDYQGQTVIELDTGGRRDFLPKEAEEGHGFCWASSTYNSTHQVLIVDGCYWACSYEYRVYDFSDPMEGWPQVEPFNEDGSLTYFDMDYKTPTLSDDGKLTIYQTKDIDDYKEDYEVEDVSDVEWEGGVPDDPEEDERRTVVATTTFKLEDGKFVYDSHWVSEVEQAYRIEQERRRKAYKEAEAKFKAEDPLYLAYKEEIKDPILRPDKDHGRGYTYEGWHPEHKYEETRWCCRIYSPERKDNYEKTKGYTIDFEWAAKTGPVKLIIYKDGKSHDTKFWMEHSVESVRAAFAYAKALIQEAAGVPPKRRLSSSRRKPKPSRPRFKGSKP